MKKMRKILSNILLAVVSVFFALVLLEIFANVYLLRWADEEKFIRYASLRQLQKRKLSNKPKYSPHRYLGYYPTPNYVRGKNRHNSLGYRGEEIHIPKPDGQFRIACLGGSTTYTGKIEDYKMSYPYLLEKYLRGKGYKNVDVVNAGAASWSSWESLINFELRVLDLDPDMIIVYHGINDIHPRLVWPPGAYQGDNSGHRAPNQVGISMPSIFEYSTLLRILMINAGITISHAALERTLDKSPETYYGFLFRIQKLRGVYPQGIFKEISAEEMLKTNKPVFFERNIRNIAAIAKNLGIKVILSSFAYSPLFSEYPRISSWEYVSAYAENNHLLEELAEEMDVHFFDFASKFPTEKRYYTDGRHVSEEGVQLKAELFGNFLIEKRLLTSAEKKAGTTP
jgi:lysophospholipase L1-like esterase